MTPGQAYALAEKVRRAISVRCPADGDAAMVAADLRRVECDLAAILSWHGEGEGARAAGWLSYAANNLRRTAAVHNVKEDV